MSYNAARNSDCFQADGLLKVKDSLASLVPVSSSSWGGVSFESSFLQGITEKYIGQKTTQRYLGKEADVQPGHTIEF